MAKRQGDCLDCQTWQEFTDKTCKFPQSQYTDTTPDIWLGSHTSTSVKSLVSLDSGRLVGQVVKASAPKAEGPEFESCDRIFPD